MTLLLLSLLVRTGPVLVRDVRYDGPDHLEDRCTGMVVGQDGSVYLTGYSLGRETDFEFATVRLDTAGDTVWTRRYGSDFHSEDRPWFLTPGPDGGVVTAGASIGSAENGWDYLTIRYRPDGDTAWLRRTDFPPHSHEKIAGLATGPGGDVFVTGRSRNRDSAGVRDWDIATVRYSAEGETAWTRRFDGGLGRDDQGTGIAVDAGGNCFVAGRTVRRERGTDVAVMMYDGAGSRKWQRFIGEGGGANVASGLLLDNSGRPCLYGALHNGAKSYDYLLACFERDGRPAWRLVLDGAGSVDMAQAACLDARGDVIVTGQSAARGSSVDVLTVRCSAAGDTLWARRYNGPQNSEDRGWSIAPGPGGTVIVGATSVGPSGHPDMVLLCYSETGEELWTWRYWARAGGEVRPTSIAWDETRQRLLVAGHAPFPGTGYDFLLVQLELPE